MLSISIALLAFYVVLISYFFIGWMLVVYRKNKASVYNNQNATGFSIVISARNEEQNIEACLQSISQQKYPNELFEIIVIDDGSTDKTADIIHTFINQSRSIGTTFNIHYVKSDLKNKKAAITMGISDAQHDYIVLTDADCTRNENWLSAINQFVKQSGCKLIYAPVRFKAQNIFEKMQALEFAGLVGIGAASMELKNPNMCSAANLIFEKKVFNEVNGYQDNMHLLSGDDEFLMHKIFKLYPDKVKFLLNYDAMVTTTASSSVEELAEQRKRWVSKATKYENRYITLILILAYLFNASIFINFVWGFFDSFYFKLSLSQLLIKMIIEFAFLSQVARHLKQFHLIKYLILAEPLHVIYVLFVGIAGSFGSFEWKGRVG